MWICGLMEPSGVFIFNGHLQAWKVSFLSDHERTNSLVNARKSDHDRTKVWTWTRLSLMNAQKNYVRSFPDLRAFMIRLSCVHQTIRAFMNRLSCVHQTMRAFMIRLSCVHQTIRAFMIRLSCVHQTIRAFMIRLSCVHQTIRAFMSRLSCVFPCFQTM